MLSYPFTDIVICLLSSLLKYAAARINNGNLIVITVSTHSRPKVAAYYKWFDGIVERVSTHSHPKVAAGRYWHCIRHQTVSTHSRPKAAAGYFKRD